MAFISQNNSSPIQLNQYIHDPHKPKIAAHRGSCGLLPENSLEAFDVAMYEGTDFIELDVVLCKNNELISTHDVYLSRLTNIADMKKYSDRKCRGKVEITKDNGYIFDERDDWWLKDFTLDELKELKLNQVQVKGRTKIFDQLFSFSSLEEVINFVIEFNNQHAGKRNPDKHLVGILIEIKDIPYHRREFKAELIDLVLELLKKMNLDSVEKCAKKVPLVIMSFDVETIQQGAKRSDLPRVQLIKESWFKNSIKEIEKYANAIGPDINMLWNKSEQKPSKLYEEIKKSNLLIYSWAFRDDFQTMELFKAKNSQQLYEKAMKQLSLDGIITEFPGTAQSYAQAYRRILSLNQ